MTRSIITFSLLLLCLKSIASTTLYCFSGTDLDYTKSKVSLDGDILVIDTELYLDGEKSSLGNDEPAILHKKGSVYYSKTTPQKGLQVYRKAIITKNNERLLYDEAVIDSGLLFSSTNSIYQCAPNPNH